MFVGTGNFPKSNKIEKFQLTIFSGGAHMSKGGACGVHMPRPAHALALGRMEALAVP